MLHFILLFLFFGSQSCSQKWHLVTPPAGRTLESFQAEAGHAMVVTPNKEATEVGLAVLQKGGTAVDAAIAVSFALGVLRPQSTGIGGGGFMLIHNKKDGKTVALNFRELAPAKATRNMFVKNGKADPKLSQDGALSVAVPRLVAGLGDIYDHYASKKIPWPELVQPSVDLAERGFSVYPRLAYAIEERKDVLSRSKSAKEIFLPHDKPLQVGDTLVEKDLAKTLKTVAQKGWSGFYEGWVSAAIIRSVQMAGGILTVDDLWHTEPIEAEPVEGTYHGYKIVSMPLPSSGGTTLIETLNILESFPISRWGAYNLKTVHVMTEALRRAFLDRSRYLGDPRFVKNPVKGLTAKDYAKTLAETIDMKKATPSRSMAPQDFTPKESSSTTHFSIVDAEGNAVVSTQTINYYFGSGMVVGGTGIVLNDEMDDFSIQPGVPNVFGLVGNEANAIEAGKKPLSSMSPTFVFNPKGELVMALGSPGGPKIITAVLNTIVNRLDFGASPLEAVAALRVHHQWLPDKLQVEGGLLDEVSLKKLTAMGHEIKELHEFKDRPWLVELIAKTKKGWIGISDPRGNGTPSGF